MLRSLAVRAHPAVVACLLVATLDWLLGALRVGGYTVGQLAAGWLLAAGLWMLIAITLTLLGALAAWAWLGRIEPGALGERAGGALRRTWQERGSDADRVRLTRLTGSLAGALVFATGSVALVAYLVEYRHGSKLIALATLAGQTLLAGAAIVVGAAVARGTRRVVGAVRALQRLHAPGVALASAALALLGALTAALVYWETVLALDGIAWLLPLLAVALVPVLARAWRPRRVSWVAIPLLAAPLALMGGAHAAGARTLVLRDAYTARYALAFASRASDFDGDGSPAFPMFDDCAPFDASVHPLAKEIPDNGADENCDGRDRPLSQLAVRHKPFARPGPAPNLVLVTFDATRADHVGFLGYDRPTTPNLDRVARRGVIFERAFSQDSGTGPSIWSLMAGQTPFQVSLRDADRFPPNFAPDERLLAELLRGAGYHTEALLCGRVWSTGHWNLRRGFARYRNVCRKREPDEAKRVTEQAIATLKRAREPFFLWVHYYDPHHPYRHHDAHDFGDRPIDNYDEEIRAADAGFGRFYGALDRRTWKRPVYLTFGSDHGENFGDHGSTHHARTLYREVTHIPMFIAGPGVEPGRVATPVALNDLYPTFLDLAGVPIPKQCTMVSQARVLFGIDEPDPDRLVFQENSYARPRRHVKAVVSQRYHYIMDLTTKTEELYDHRRDPRERSNLIDSHLDEARTLHRALRDFLATSSIPEALRE